MRSERTNDDRTSPHDIEAPPTCPSCNALVNANLYSCRSCGQYLRGNGFDKLLFERLVPAGPPQMAATNVISAALVACYVIAGLSAGFEHLLSQSTYSLRAFGAASGPLVVWGEPWRFVTSVFGHADLIHLAFNLMALRSIGPLFEQLYGRRETVTVFIVGGALSMLCSHLWHVYLPFGGSAAYTTVGASGAVCVLIGAAVVGLREFRERNAELYRRLVQWAVLIIVVGLALDSVGVDNGAHIGGFITGILLAFPLRWLSSRRAVSKAVHWSGAMYGALALALVSAGLMFAALRGIPTSLERDGTPSRLFFITIHEGTAWEQSDQVRLFNGCRNDILAAHDEGEAFTDTMLNNCRAAALANSHAPIAWGLLTEAWRLAGDPSREQRADDAMQFLRKHE